MRIVEYKKFLNPQIPKSLRHLVPRSNGVRYAISKIRKFGFNRIQVKL